MALTLLTHAAASSDTTTLGSLQFLLSTSLSAINHANPLIWTTLTVVPKGFLAMILADEEMILITVQIFQNDLNCKDRSENCNTLV